MAPKTETKAVSFGNHCKQEVIKGTLEVLCYNRGNVQGLGKLPLLKKIIADLVN
jgi:hypothetical protein